MEEKNNYTKQEMENVILSSIFWYGEYRNKYSEYIFSKDHSSGEERKRLNETIENCEKNIPKSLIDKLGIKKIQVIETF